MWPERKASPVTSSYHKDLGQVFEVLMQIQTVFAENSLYGEGLGSGPSPTG